jgi:tRNA threonylcarbamoyladenosine biosynthesis protein TsaE
MKTIESKSVEETKKLAQEFVSDLKQQENGATVVCLFGDLGSGKTTFVKQVAIEFGIEEIVTSPTFVIEKIYKVDRLGFKKFIHIDAYRLEEGGELLALGWKEMIANKENIIFIEWPKFVASALPEKRHNITFTFLDENTRKVDFI